MATISKPDTGEPLLIELRPRRTGDQSLYLQIFLRIREAILNGNLPNGARVPSIRALASELQVSRNTVEKAYDLLVGDGLLATNGSSGTTVSYRHSPCRRDRPAKPTPSTDRDSAQKPRLCSVSTEPRHPTVANDPLLSTLAEQLSIEKPRPFQLGLPALDAFPFAPWLTLGRRVLRDKRSFDQVEEVQGYLPLRQLIAAYLQISRGITCSASQVFITQGYRQSLSLAVNAQARRGDDVWLEDPVYPVARRLLRRLNLNVVPVPVDQQGIDVATGLERAPQARLAIVTPANQSPLGAVMSLPRRQALLTWACRSDAVLLEDDYDSEFCKDGRLLPTLCSMDHTGCCIYLGSFSKALHPALRVSYIVVPSGAIPAFHAACSDMIDGSPLLTQRILASFMVEGHFSRHLKHMRALYAKRRKMLTDALKSQLADNVTTPSSTSGGLSVLARLRGGLIDSEITARAEQHGLSLGTLSSRRIDSDPGQGLLLGYANFTDQTAITAAVDKLADCFRS